MLYALAVAAVLAVVASPLVLLVVLMRRRLDGGRSKPDMPGAAVSFGSLACGWLLGSVFGSGLYLAVGYQPRDSDIHSGCSLDGVMQFVIGAAVGAPLGVLLAWFALTRREFRLALIGVVLAAAACWTAVMLRPVLSNDTCGGAGYLSQRMEVLWMSH